MLVRQLIEWESMSLKESNPSWGSSLILAKIICASEWEINSERLEISKNEKKNRNRNKSFIMNGSIKY